MRQVPLIPGPAFDPSPYAPAQSHGRSSRLFRTVVIVWLLAGVGVLAFKFLPETSQAGDIAHPAKTPNAAANTEDLVHHMDAVMARLSESAANLRRAEDQVSRTLSIVEQWEVCEDSLRVDLLDDSIEFRLGPVQIFS